jgi:hypothetical protein
METSAQHSQFGFALSVKNREPFSKSKLKNSGKREGGYSECKKKKNEFLM